MSKKENIKNPGQKQIDEWKQQYGEVHLLSVSKKPSTGEMVGEMDDEDTFKAYLKKPDRSTRNYAISTMPRSIIQAGEAVVKNSWLGGDPELKDDPEYSASAALQAIELIDTYETSLKKL